MGGTATGTFDINMDDPASPPDSPPSSYDFSLAARYPGAAGNLRITLTPKLGRNVLVGDDSSPPEVSLRGLQVRDTVAVIDTSNTPSIEQGFYDVDQNASGEYTLEGPHGIESITMDQLDPESHEVRRVTVTVEFERPLNRPQQPGAQYAPPEVLDDFTLDPVDSRSLLSHFSQDAPSRHVALYVPFFIAANEVSASSGADLTGADVADSLFRLEEGEASGQTITLTGGSDGRLPGITEFQGSGGREKTGLQAIQDIENVSIVAAPGYSARGAGEDTKSPRIQAVQGALISHCETMKYRIAVLDTPDRITPTEAVSYRGTISSTHAALYYPWVTVFDPISRAELNLPPSGFIAGIYARNDANRGVQKAPANEVVRLAVNMETRVNGAQQDVLNPESVNCLRFFEGRGYRVWGARLTTDDVEYKYVNIRRYLAYLQRSIDQGTQVFVFESNGPKLWENVSRTVENFLRNEWRSGRLLGTTESQAYFVRCDLSTMTQNDLDNGRLICEVGVSLLRPAEFVIFRIGQKLIESTG
jgi:hypothetical protein